MNKGTTIFIPVYNEVHRIEKAIRIAAPQCERLLVSDNASTDGTDAICKNLLAEYPNMEYFRQEKNIGAYNNWLFLLRQVETPYVLALGSHDFIADNYVGRLQAVLDHQPDTELAMGELFHDFGAEPVRYDGFSNWQGGEQDEAKARVRSCIFDRINLGWTAYGLFRTSTVKQIMLGEDNPTYGIDIILLAKIATRGKIRIVPTTRYYAWVRDTKKNGPTYFERLLGQDQARSNRFKMRNEFRRALYEIYVSTNGWKSYWELLKARYRYMVRIGTFKNPTADGDYYLLHLPVKLSRRMIRGF